MFTPNFKNKALLIPLVFLAWITNGVAQNLSPDLAVVSSPLSKTELPFVALKKGSNLPADGREATDKQVPILMFFSMQHCPFCTEVEEDYLKPMLRNAAYDKKIIIRKIRIDGSESVRDFAGNERDAGEFSEDYSVSMVPTVILVDAKGNRIAPSIIGIANPHYYSYELDQAIDKSTLKIRSLARR